MRKILAIILVMFSVMCLRSAAEDQAPPEYEPGVVMVGLKEGADLTTVLTTAQITPTAAYRLFPAETKVAQYRYYHPEAQSLRDETVFDLAYAEMIPEEKALYRIYVINLPETLSVEEAIDNKLAGNPQVEFAQPDYYYKFDSASGDYLYPPSIVPPGYGQWALRNDGAEAGWKRTRGDPKVIIAIIDSGIDYNHQDLKGNMWLKTSEWPPDGADSDKPPDYLADDYRGWDFLITSTGYGDNDPFEPTQPIMPDHGTAVAGVATAKGKNICGLSGVCPDCSIMNLRTSQLSKDVSAAIYYAINNGAKIINMSKNTDAFDANVAAALNYAAVKGLVLVGCAGNSYMFGINPPAQFPATEAEVIAVTSLREKGWQRYIDARFGPEVDFSAPGENVLVTTPTIVNSGTPPSLTMVTQPPYTKMTGTSFAAPYVAGLAGLILSRYPDCDRDDVRYRLEQGAMNIDDQNLTQCDGNSCAGLIGKKVDIYRSLAGLAIEGRPSVGGKPGETVEFKIRLRNDGVPLESVNATLTLNSPSGKISILNGTATYPNFTRFSEAGATQENNLKFRIEISNSLSGEFREDLTLTLKGRLSSSPGKDTYEEKLDFYVIDKTASYAPDVINDPLIVKWAKLTSCNCATENKTAKRFNLYLPLYNKSLATDNAHAVKLTLTKIDNDYLSIIEDTADYGDIPIGTKKTNTAQPFVIDQGQLASANTTLYFRVEGANIEPFVIPLNFSFGTPLPPSSTSTSWSWSSSGNSTSIAGSAATDSNIPSIPTQPVLGDLNLDGNLETIVPVPAEGMVYCLSSTGTELWRYPLSAGSIAVYPLIVDLNGDGRPEIVLSEYGLNTIEILSSSGGFLAKKEGIKAGVPAAGDLDGVALTKEIVVAKDGMVTALRFDATAGTIPALWEKAIVTGVTGVLIPTLVDTNRDGRTEIVLPGWGSRVLNGAGNLVNFLSTDSPATGFAVKDVTGDGLSEIFTGTEVLNYNGSILAYPNIASGEIEPFEPIGAPIIFNTEPSRTNIFLRSFDPSATEGSGKHKYYLHQFVYASDKLDLVRRIPLDDAATMLSVYQESNVPDAFAVVSDTNGNAKMLNVHSPNSDQYISIGPGATFAPLFADIDGDGKVEMITGTIDPIGSANIICTKFNDSASFALDNASWWTQMQHDAGRTGAYNIAPNQYSLTVNAVNGTVQRDLPGPTYAQGTQVKLTAVPNAGYTFTGWSGGLNGSANPVSITMDSAKAVTANFARPPAAPTNLTATAITLKRITLSWMDNSTNETGFKIERSYDGKSFTQVATVGANIKAYTDMRLTAGKVYYYRVRAYNTLGNSSYSNVTQATAIN